MADAFFSNKQQVPMASSGNALNGTQSQLPPFAAGSSFGGNGTSSGTPSTAAATSALTLPVNFPGRDASDDEADAKLGTNFPEFYYGTILKYSRLLERSKKHYNAAQVQSGVKAKRRKIDTDLSDDGCDILESIEVDPFVWRKYREKKKRKLRKRIETATSAMQEKGEASPDGDEDNDAMDVDESERKSYPTKGESDSDSEPSVDNESEIPLVAFVSWEDAIVWGDEPKTAVLQDGQAAARSAALIRAFHEREEKAKAKAKEEADRRNETNAAEVGQEAAAPEDDELIRGTKERQDMEERLKVEARIKIPEEIASSMFSPGNDYLASGKWLDMVVWDEAHKNKDIPHQISKVNIDLNDEELLLGTTIDRPVWMKRPLRLTQQTGRNRVPTWQLRQREKAMEANKKRRALEGIPAPTGEAGKDPFNISNDQFHTKDGKTKTTNIALKHSIGKSVVEHSLPARRLDPLCFKYDWLPQEKAVFHREPLRREKYSSRDKGELKVWRSCISCDEENPAKRSRTVQHGKQWKAKDLHAIDGEIVLAEYCEEYPLVVQNPGMCTLVRNYYKQASQTDTNKQKFVHGPTLLVGPNEASPFLGQLEPRESLQSFENNLFRAPIYLHKPKSTDFLIIRSPADQDLDSNVAERYVYHVRALKHIYTVGQILPKVEVPKPMSKQNKDYNDMRMSVHIQRRFLPNKYGERQVVKVEEVKKLFHSHTDPYIRARIKEFAVTLRDLRSAKGSEIGDELRSANDNGAWVWNEKNNSEVSQSKLEKMLRPEQVCAYESMLAAAHRLKETGWNSDEYKMREQQGDSGGTNQKWTVEDEVNLAPWVLTTDFQSYLKDKCLICVTGKGEPTGCQEGFNYMRKPHKPVESNAPESKLLPAGMTSEKKKLTKLAGTDADLRTMLLADAVEMLKGFGLAPELLKRRPSEVKKPGEYRWRMIAYLRDFFTKKANENETDHRFARGQQSSHAELLESHKQDCDRIFKQQNHSLRSDEVLTSEEEDSSDDDDDDDREANALEDLAASQMGTQARIDNNRNKKDAKIFEELKKTMQSDKASAIGTDVSGTVGGTKIGTEGASTVASGATKTQKKRTLVITRLIGSVKKKEIVYNPAVIDMYLRRKALGNKEGTRANFKREERRIKAQLKQLEKQEAIEANSDGGPASPAISSVSGTSRSTAPNARAHNLKCSKCGAIGHTRASKKCPYFRSEAPSAVLQSGEVEEGSTELVGTKLKINSSLLKQKELSEKKKQREKAERERRRQRERQKKIERERRMREEGLTPSEARQDPSMAFHYLLNEILDTLIEYDRVNIGGTFMNAVDRALYMDYYNIVPHPMYLAKIQEKIRKQGYKNRICFIDDFRKIASNAMLFNGPEHAVYEAGSKLRMEAIDLCLKYDEKLTKYEKLMGTYTELKADKDEERDGDFERSEQDAELAQSAAGL